MLIIGGFSYPFVTWGKELRYPAESCRFIQVRTVDSNGNSGRVLTNSCAHSAAASKASGRVERTAGSKHGLVRLLSTWVSARVPLGTPLQCSVLGIGWRGRAGIAVTLFLSYSCLFLSRLSVRPSVCLFLCRRFFEGVSHSGSQTEIGSLHSQKGQDQESGSPVSYTTTTTSCPFPPWPAQHSRSACSSL